MADIDDFRAFLASKGVIFMEDQPGSAPGKINCLIGSFSHDAPSDGWPMACEVVFSDEGNLLEIHEWYDGT